jgi:D-alanyl-D-alanine carboxypeptidase (penicillin-binding protein 5/6)
MFEIRATKFVPVSSQNNSTWYLFVKEMNILANKLHLKGTRYANPHGLADKANHSTAYDVASLTAHVMKVPTISKIVSDKTY